MSCPALDGASHATPSGVILGEFTIYVRPSPMMRAGCPEAKRAWILVRSWLSGVPKDADG